MLNPRPGRTFRALSATLAILCLTAGIPGIRAVSAAAPAPPPPPSLSYADLTDLADNSPAVIRAQIRKVIAVEPARAPGVKSGWARIYVEARTVSLLAGTPLTGDSLRYLADVPLDAKGKLPKLTKREVLLFGRKVAGRPGEIQLIAPDAQVPWSAETEARLRGVLTELVAPAAPARIGGVREAIYVPGNLAEEGESQMFLATANGEPASITVVRAPGQPPRWSVSFSEVLAADGSAPARETLAWYRLACFLPRTLDPKVNVSATESDRAQAEADYRFVLDALGPCGRTRG